MGAKIKNIINCQIREGGTANVPKLGFPCKTPLLGDEDAVQEITPYNNKLFTKSFLRTI